MYGEKERERERERETADLVSKLIQMQGRLLIFFLVNFNHHFVHLNLYTLNFFSFLTKPRLKTTRIKVNAQPFLFPKVFFFLYFGERFMICMYMNMK